MAQMLGLTVGRAIHVEPVVLVVVLIDKGPARQAQRAPQRRTACQLAPGTTNAAGTAESRIELSTQIARNTAILTSYTGGVLTHTHTHTIPLFWRASLGIGDMARDVRKQRRSIEESKDVQYQLRWQVLDR